MTMISSMTLAACFVTLFVSLLLPVIAISVLSFRNKGAKMVSAWLLGAAGFFVTQILIRIPILTVLQSQPWFVTFSQNNGFLYAFLLAFTAGLFELVGRFVVAKLMQKNLNCNRSIAAGLGHGGIEAMILIGITYLNNILYIFMINSGTFDAVVSEAMATGIDVSALLTVRDQLISASPALFLLGGFERILAMIAHLAMTMTVCYSLHLGKALKGALICLGIHTFLDLTAGISLLIGNGLSEAAAYTIIYTLLTVMAVLSILIIRKIRHNWKETGV